MNMTIRGFVLLTLFASPLSFAAEFKFHPSPAFIVPPVELSSRQKIIGTADFEKVRDLPQSSTEYASSKKIAFLTIQSPQGGYVCSGSFVGPDLYLTNEHCVAAGGGTVPPSALKVYPEYLQDQNYGPEYAVTDIVAVDGPLDFALLRVAGRPGDKYGWLKVNADPGIYSRTRSVKIIQHPAGRSKEISRRNNEVVNVAAPVIHYIADTEGGSSGSPVFGEDGNLLIGLHHVGTLLYNEAVLASSIYPRIQQYLPKPPATSKPPKAKPPAPKPPVSQKPPRRDPPPAKAKCTANDFLTGNKDCE
jgi:V8-like Glu-specific endopeptidase